jgi:hypothetical protein
MQITKEVRKIAKRRFLRFVPLAGAALLIPALCQAQTILPQIADGGNWYTAVVLMNTTTNSITGSVTFYQDTANGATAPWNPPFLEVSSTQNLMIPPGGTLYMHTAGTAATLTQGWGQVIGPLGLTAYAIYTYESYAGRPNQDGSAAASTSTTRILVPFDATTGYSTGVAVVNPTGLSETISVNIETDTGAISQGSLPTLPPSGQIAFSMATQFPATVGHRGLAEFYDLNGQLSIAAFRFNPTIALTSLPVVLTSGSPVIGGNPPGSFPQFSQIIFNNFGSLSGQSIGLSGITVNMLQPGGTFGNAILGGSLGTTMRNGATWR